MKESNSVHILVVDDCIADIETIKITLEDHHISNPVIVAGNGREALNIMRGEAGFTRIPKPLIVLLDWFMPVMSGAEFLTSIAKDKFLKHSLIYVMTGADSRETQGVRFLPQVAGFIQKQDIGRFLAENRRIFERGYNKLSA